MKNTGPFLAFNEEWFKRNQRLLLWLLNAPVIKRWFRWVMSISRADLPLDKEVYAIGSNRFYFDAIENHVTVDFRTHPKYGKRIYYAFRPLWWAIHLWDWLVADRYIPDWSYGFDTLTTYPNANPETVSVDGYVYRSTTSETHSTIRAGAGNGHDDSATNIGIAELDASTTSSQYSLMLRGIFLFDTSSLTSGATISAATISFWGSGKANGLGSPALHVAGSTPASNTALADADYGQCQSTSFGSVAYASYDSTNAVYTDITLNASGISNISKTGVSKFCTRLSWDINNSFTGSWVSSAHSEFDAQTADTSGTSNDPKLVVTYTLGGSLPPMIKLQQAIFRASFY